eukprot:1001566-Prorocentrum_minimum.AAC.1
MAGEAHANGHARSGWPNRNYSTSNSDDMDEDPQVAYVIIALPHIITALPYVIISLRLAASQLLHLQQRRHGRGPPGSIRHLT